MNSGNVDLLHWDLPETLEYVGEFGSELVLFLPFCVWLSKTGALSKRRIKTYRGMRCFYDDLQCAGIIEKDDLREYVPPDKRLSCLPVKNEHNFDGLGRSPFHMYPDLRRKFRPMPLPARLQRLERPLLIVHNKYNDEWGEGAINYIALDTLDTIFARLKRKFCIVYIRHGSYDDAAGFSVDHNHAIPLGDSDVLKRHPEVHNFDDLFMESRRSGEAQDLNTFKNVIYSRCYRFISSQGGGAHQIALFGGSLLVILHRQGAEEFLAYSDGYYDFMAAIAPIRAICRTQQDLVRALPLFANSTIVDDRLFVAASNGPLLAQFSPWKTRRPV